MPEPLYKTGEVMITHSALVLLNALGTGHRIVHGEGNVRKAMRRLSCYWAIGRGPYTSLATLGRR